MEFNQNIGEVDKVEITVLMDDYSGYESKFIGQHGLSLLIDVLSEGKVERMLFDVGQSAEMLLHNMDLAGVSLESINEIFLSHCHYDHTKGLNGIVKKAKKNIPIIAHSSIFRENYSVDPEFINVGITWENRKENLIESGAELILEDSPYKFVDGVISTGEVERSNCFEEINQGLYYIDSGKMTADPMKDDNSIIINIRNKGLLIVTGCSHSGIINIIEHSIKVTGVNNVYGIVGGLHLIEASKDIIDKTISELDKFNIKLFGLGHCTGLDALYLIKEKFGEKFIMLNSGKQISIE